MVDGEERRRLNADKKRALKAADLDVFVKKYGRKAQKRGEPNDRHFDRKTEKRIKRMNPVELDMILRDDEE